MWRCRHKARPGCPWLCGFDAKTGSSAHSASAASYCLIVLSEGLAGAAGRGRHLQLHHDHVDQRLHRGSTGFDHVGGCFAVQRIALGIQLCAAFCRGCSPAAGAGAVVLHALEDLFGRCPQIQHIAKSRSTWRFSGAARRHRRWTAPCRRAAPSPRPAPGPRCRENALRLRLQKLADAGLQHLFQLVRSRSMNGTLSRWARCLPTVDLPEPACRPVHSESA